MGFSIDPVGNDARLTRHSEEGSTGESHAFTHPPKGAAFPLEYSRRSV
jgi:hypothetical protein